MTLIGNPSNVLSDNLAQYRTTWPLVFRNRVGLTEGGTIGVFGLLPLRFAAGVQDLESRGSSSGRLERPLYDKSQSVIWNCEGLLT